MNSAQVEVADLGVLQKVGPTHRLPKPTRWDVFQYTVGWPTPKLKPYLKYPKAPFAPLEQVFFLVKNQTSG